MKKIIFLLILMLSSIISAKDIHSISVMEFKSHGVKDYISQQITEAFSTYIVSMDSFEVMERSQMNEILKEQSFQQSGGCDDNSCMVEAGQLLGVEYMLFGSLGKLEDSYTINLKLLNVTSGQIENQVYSIYKGSLSDFIDKKLPALGNKILLPLVGKKGPAIMVQKQEPNQPKQQDIKKESKTGKIIAIVTSSIITIGTGTYGFIKNNEVNKLKKEYDEMDKNSSEEDFNNKWTEIGDTKTMRNIMYGVSATGAVAAITITILF